MIYAYFGKCEAKYFGLFHADNDSTAIRIVEEELCRNQKFQTYSSEYSLYCLCDFNDDTGVVSQLGPVSIRLVSDLDNILLNYIVRQRRNQKMLKDVSGLDKVNIDSSSDIDNSSDNLSKPDVKTLDSDISNFM